MTTTWLKRAAAFALIVALIPTLASGQDRASGAAPAGFSAGIAAEAAKLASGDPRQSGEFESASRRSSNQRNNSQVGRRAAYGFAFGFIGMLVGAKMAEDLRGPGPTQLLAISAATATGVTVGIWLGGR
jgi:hypothetical protein